MTAPRCRRRGFCSAACRQAAYRARQRGDAQALFDRWLALLPTVLRGLRAHREAEGLAGELQAKHGIDPHEELERIHTEMPR